MSYRSVLNVSNGGPSNPKLTLKINSLGIKRKAQNFASWMLSEYAFKIGRKKGNDFFILVPLCWLEMKHRHAIRAGVVFRELTVVIRLMFRNK